MAARSDPDQSLKRLGGGRWQTHDGRFTIQAQSGTWVVVDAEQTDELGLPLVRGPFQSLTAARAAIVAARAGGPVASPLAAAGGPVASPHAAASAPPEPPRATSRPGATAASSAARTDAPERAATDRRRPSEGPGRREPASAGPTEPRWLTELAPDERRRARRLLRALGDAGARDPEHVVRRDTEGHLPAVAAWAIARALAALGPDPSVEAVVGILSDGRDRELDVRWRLVDGDGRPITLEDRDLREGRDVAASGATARRRG